MGLVPAGHDTLEQEPQKSLVSESPTALSAWHLGDLIRELFCVECIEDEKAQPGLEVHTRS